MQLVWIPQWTALPVIVEDPKMSERNGVGSRLLLGQPGGESLAQPKIGEREGYSASCQFGFWIINVLAPFGNLTAFQRPHTEA